MYAGMRYASLLFRWLLPLHRLMSLCVANGSNAAQLL